MQDSFKDHAASLTGPAGHAAGVVPDDGADLAVLPRALYVGGAGDLQVRLAGDTAPVTFRALAVGWHPIRACRVHATGTTATDIVAVW